MLNEMSFFRIYDEVVHSKEARVDHVHATREPCSATAWLAFSKKSSKLNGLLDGHATKRDEVCAFQVVYSCVRDV
jgi:hypothetical protein